MTTDHHTAREAIARHLADQDAAAHGGLPYADPSWAGVRARWYSKADAILALPALAALREKTNAEQPPTDAATVLHEAIDELDRLGDEHWQQGDALSRVIDGFRLWARGRADELTVRYDCPECGGQHTDYEYGDAHRNPEGGH
jgi:hypothetical protein